MVEQLHRRRQRVKRVAAAAVGGSVLAAGAAVGSAPVAGAQEWHSPFGEQAYSFSARLNSNNLWITYGRTMRMQGWALSAAPGDGTLNFYQDHIKSYVNDMGSGSVFGGCLYLPAGSGHTARHGNPFEITAHNAHSVVAGFWSTTQAYSDYLTAEYKETGYTDPHFVQRQHIFSISGTVCNVVGSHIFNSVYK